MDGKWMFRSLMGVGVVCGLWSAAEAAAPWNNVLGQKTVDADPNKTYALTEAEGPWMIMACSFSGEGAEKQAQDLAIELRKRYKLPAYVFQGRFTLGEAQPLGVDKYGNPQKGAYYKYHKEKYKDSAEKAKARNPELTEVAVLVGNYQSAEDPEADKALQKVKFATPQCLDMKDGKETHQDLTAWRMIQKQVYEAIGSEKKKLGPMSHAFKTTNPMLPAEFFVQRNGVDEAIVAMNRGVPYDLLECPGKYTVQVATFKGRVLIKQDEIRAVEDGTKEMKGELADAAKKADKLTKALRKKGIEAYQFHDRYASIVTVGSFNSVGTPRPDGRTEINPEIHRIMESFGPDPDKTAKVQNALKVSGMENQTMAAPVKSIEGIPFDIMPIPVQVPKRSISTAMRNKE